MKHLSYSNAPLSQHDAAEGITILEQSCTPTGPRRREGYRICHYIALNHTSLKMLLYAQNIVFQLFKHFRVKRIIIKTQTSSKPGTTTTATSKFNCYYLFLPSTSLGLEITRSKFILLSIKD